MQSYIWLTAAVYSAINFMLITAVCCITQHKCPWLRNAGASIMGGMYTLLALLSEIEFFRSGFCHGLSILCICLIAFGLGKQTVKNGLLFCLLRFSLEGVGGHRTLWTVILCCVCIWIFRKERRQTVSVELLHKGKRVCFTALYDTGNTLHDPITGQPVLVVDRLIAQQLTALSEKDLQTPLEALPQNPGSRLIPYKTVGHPASFLLGITVRQAKIGGRKGSAVIALSPDILDEEGKYQGLIGGTG